MVTKKAMELDSVSATLHHRRLIQKKKFLRRLYIEFYGELKKNSNPRIKGKSIEIGSGGGFIKKVLPNTITSDVVVIPGIDLCFSGEKMPFKDKSIAHIYLLDTFHHIQDPAAFLKEASRCLQTGGRIVMIEPYVSTFSKPIYRYIHHEPFDEHVKSWRLPKGGRMSVANDANPWNIFVRDRKKFNRIFPEFRIVRVRPHTPFRYWLSGGVSLPSLVPGFLFSAITFGENILAPLGKSIGCFATYVIEKR